MSPSPRRPPLLLKAAAIVVALFALLGFVAAAGAGAKGKGADSADGGVAKNRPLNYFPASKSAGGMRFNSDGELRGSDGGAAKRKPMYFPASKSPGDFFPPAEDKQVEPVQQQQSPVQQKP